VVDNDRADILHHFEECIEFIETILAENEKVLVHCHAGVSRSATIVCAYLMKKHGKSVKKALAR
jgi:dual specificity phosphatase 12